MTHDELVEEYCESNGYEICPLSYNPDQICINPNHCEQCEAEYAEWLESKEKQIEEMAQDIFHSGVALDGVDFAYGLFDDDDHFRRLARKLYAAGYRKADEVRKETAREILQMIKAFPRDWIHSYQKGAIILREAEINQIAAEYGVGVEDERE